MIIGQEHLQASIDAWTNGERSPLFNQAATEDHAARTVDMTAANDYSRPGILGFNR